MFLVCVNAGPPETITLAVTATDILESNCHQLWGSWLTDVSVESVWDVDITERRRALSVTLLALTIREFCPYDRVHLEPILEIRFVEDSTPAMIRDSKRRRAIPRALAGPVW